MSLLPSVRESLLAAVADGPAVEPARLQRRPPRHRQLLFGAVATACGIAVLAVAAASSMTAPGNPEPSAMAAAITGAPVSGGAVWRAASEIAATTPQPAAQPVSLQWVGPLAAGRAAVARAELAAVIEHRAMCAWYRAWLDGGPQRGAAAERIAAIPSWPTIAAGALRRPALTAAAAAGGGDAAAVRDVVEVNC